MRPTIRQPARVAAPTLVLHLRDDVFVPFEQGRHWPR